MMYDVILIVIGIILFLSIEHVSYWIKVRNKFLTRIENERLEVYLELQRLCLDSFFKGGCPEHDKLITYAERYPSLHLLHVIRLVFNHKYREHYESLGEKVTKQLNTMPKKAKVILDKLQSADIKLTAVRYPFSFMILLFFAFILVLRSKAKRLSDAEKTVSEFLVKKGNSESIYAAV